MREGFGACRVECIHSLANYLYLGVRVLLEQCGNCCRFQHVLFSFAGQEHEFPAAALVRSRDGYRRASGIAENFNERRWGFAGNSVDDEPLLRKGRALQRDVERVAHDTFSAIAGKQVFASHLPERAIRRANGDDDALRALLKRLDCMLKVYFDAVETPESIQQHCFKFGLVKC